MQIIFETSHPGARMHHKTALERLKFALQRMDWRVHQVKVRLDDANGPRGGFDKECTVRLSGPAYAPLVVRAVASNWRQALVLAIERAAGLLVKTVKRSQFGGRRRSVKRDMPVADPLS